MIAGLLLAILLIANERPLAAGIAFAASALVKLYTLALAPIFVRGLDKRGLIAAVLTAVVTYLPFATAGPAILQGLRTEASDVIFSDAGHFLVRRVIGLVADDPGPPARALCGLIVLAAGIVLWLRPDPRPAALGHRSYFLLGLLIFFLPMIQPWYLTWMLPFLCLALRPGYGWRPFALTPGLGWLLWTGSVELTDFTYLVDDARLWWYLRAVQLSPLLASFGWSVWRTLGERFRDVVSTMGRDAWSLRLRVPNTTGPEPAGSGAWPDHL